MDARRNQVYTGLYEFYNKDHSSEMHIVKEQCVLSVEEILGEINQLGREVIFLGDGVPVYRKSIEECCGVPFLFADASHARQRASCVGVLAQKYYEENRIQSADEHAPEYLRLSQAERERQEHDSVSRNATK